MTEPTDRAPTTPPPPSGSWQPPSQASTSDFGVPVATGPAPGVAYADTVQRVIAYIIDVVIFWVVALLLIPILIFSIFATGTILSSLVIGIIALVASAAYFIYTWTKLRATIGQKVLGLEVVNASDGSTLTTDQAVRRWAFLFGPSALGSALGFTGSATLGVLGSIIGLAAFVYQLYLLYTVTQNPKRQGFHDVQASTVVIKRA